MKMHLQINAVQHFHFFNTTDHICLFCELHWKEENCIAPFVMTFLFAKIFILSCVKQENSKLLLIHFLFSYHKHLRTTKWWYYVLILYLRKFRSVPSHYSNKRFNFRVSFWSQYKDLDRPFDQKTKKRNKSDKR